ncbi:MAG: helix-turn-helix domain-containing protein [Deltaproteobacteria bacterium]|nr:helix-turn-helix domain-containing protein [Deltaproteobacteria bacterium]
MQARSPTISPLVFGLAVKLGEGSGLSFAELCAASGVHPEQIENPWESGKAWIPHQNLNNLLAEVVRHTGNETYWLIKMVSPQVLSLENPLWYYYYNAPSLREANRRHEWFYIIQSNIAYPNYPVAGDEFSLRITPRRPDTQLSPYHVDIALSGWWGTTKEYMGKGHKPKCIRLTIGNENRRKAYENFFGAPVTTNHPFNELVFEREALDLPCSFRKVDPNLDSVLEKIIKPLVAAVSRDQPFREVVYETIQRRLHHGAPKLKDIAKSLGMSNRTLQRKLAEMEITFSNLVLETRRELAAQYLRQPGVNITEVSLLLGYVEVSAFTAAFRKWYGKSPSEYRHGQLP